MARSQDKQALIIEWLCWKYQLDDGEGERPGWLCAWIIRLCVLFRAFLAGIARFQCLYVCVLCIDILYYLLHIRQFIRQICKDNWDATIKLWNFKMASSQWEIDINYWAFLTQTKMRITGFVLLMGWSHTEIAYNSTRNQKCKNNIFLFLIEGSYYPILNPLNQPHIKTSVAGNCVCFTSLTC